MLDYIKTRNNIKFRKIGHFKVSFNTNFDPNQDFVALGFKQKDSNNLYLSRYIYI